MDYYEGILTSPLDKSDKSASEDSFTELSEIQQFFHGKTIFITGASGFLGSLLLEKILRSCVGIRKIYILLREKKGKSVETRLDDVLKYEIFEGILNKNPKLKSLISIMNGDIGEPMCGLSKENIDIIKEEVNFIVHAAACMRMQEHLKIAYIKNVRATMDLLEIAKEMKDLKAFIYVSTAYTQTYKPVISEEFYDTCYNEVHIKELVENLEDEEIAAITPKIIGGQNTYAFTKAIVESLLNRYAGNLPVAVVRPSIVVGCEKEPLVGWINNFYGPTGVTAAAFVGLLRVWYADPDKIADLIPADKVINAIISSLWRTSITFRNGEQKFPIIYNMVTSPKTPITWGEYMEVVSENSKADRIATSLVIAEYMLLLQPKKWIYFLLTLVLHLIPGLVFDFVLKLKGAKAKVIPAIIKIQNFNMLLGIYCQREWTYLQKNVDDMWNSMSENDKVLFDFDLTKLDWMLYFRTTTRAIRLYIIKDSFDTLEKSRKKYMMMVNARITITILLIFFLYYYFVHHHLKTPILAYANCLYYYLP